MYIPKHFLNTNDEEAISFMQKYSFGTIVTCETGRPVATHLPFLVEKSGTGIVISSHFAKANPQAKAIDNNEVLIIFAEPHAYISPRHYENEQSVPTWNYISVHAYGKCRLIEEEASKFKLLERTILNYEEAYQEQWNGLSSDFKERMLKGIVAFEVEVTELQAKNKLSQNKSIQEQQSIIAELSGSTNSSEVQLAEYMRLNSKE
jgi:transcriptional regulator